MNVSSPWPRLLTAALLCFACLAAARAGDSLSLRADHWLPYNGDPAAARPGYVIEIVRAILEPAGDKLDYQIMPWKRAIAEADKGAVHGVIGALKTDTPGFVFPQEPIGLSGTSAFVKKGSAWRFAGVGSFKAVRLGVIDSYSYSEELDAYIAANRDNPKALDLSTGESPETLAIKKLQAGRIDVYLSDPNVFRATVASLGLPADEFVEAGRASEPQPIYISLSPRRPDSAATAARLDAGIRALRASGELAKILNKYGLSDWAAPKP